MPPMWIRQVVAVVIAVVTIATASESGKCSQEAAQKSPAYRKCIKNHIAQIAFGSLFDLEKWNLFCKGSSEAVTCLSGIYEDCSDSFIWSLLPLPMQNGCQGSAVHPSVVSYVSNHKLMECLDSALEDKMLSCIAPVQHELSDVVDWTTLEKDRKESLIRYGYSMFKCNLIAVIFSPSCSSDVYPAIMHVLNLTLPAEMRSYFPLVEVSKPLTQRNINSPFRNTVGIYGDSHLLIHNMTQLATCSLKGKVTLLSNPLILLSAEMEVVDDSGASVISKLSIELLHSGRAMGFYEASNGQVPSHFVGRPVGEPIGLNRDRPVDITVLQPNQQIMINSTTKALVVIVARSGDGYMVTARMGQGVLDASSGLLATGCSHRDGQNINIHKIEDSPDLNDCSQLCAGMTFDEFDLEDICIYDCCTRANGKATEAGRDFVTSFRDVESMDNSLSLDEIMPTSKEKLQLESGSTIMTSNVVMIILGLVACLKL